MYIAVRCSRTTGSGIIYCIVFFKLGFLLRMLGRFLGVSRKMICDGEQVSLNNRKHPDSAQSEVCVGCVVCDISLCVTTVRPSGTGLWLGHASDVLQKQF